MLNNVGDIITEVLVRNGRTTSDGSVTDAMLMDWVRQAHKWAAAFKKWPFTEGRISTTFTAGSGVNGDEWYFEGYKSDSLKVMQVGGQRLDKLNFEDYLIFREETPEATDRVFSDYGRIVFINPRADLSGTLTAFGQYEPILDATDLTATTIFSGYDEEGNEAIVEKISGYFKRRFNTIDQAELHDQRASVKLDEIWKRIQDDQYAYKPHKTRGGMFKRFDVLGGSFDDDISEDQF